MPTLNYYAGTSIIDASVMRRPDDRGQLHGVVQLRGQHGLHQRRQQHEIYDWPSR